MRVKTAPKIGRGMKVRVKGDTTPWTVLEHHPDHGRWWLHRYTAEGVWETTDAHYTVMSQII